MKAGAWKDLAMKFRGHIISYGCHASAVLVAPDDINIWSAVEKQKDNMVVCHDYHQLEAQGLLKLDILGLETCHVIEATLEREDLNIDVENIPIDDEETAKMLQKGDTLGCFQIESNVMTPIVQKMKVKNVTDLSAAVALGRPGPLDSGMVDKFLSRRNGRSKVTYDIPDLEPILKETEGVIVYQEQIMSIARKLCGYTMGEADNLRRIIGRKIVEEMEPALVDMTKRAVMNGYDKKKVEDLIGNITAFANYGFNHCLSGDTIIMRNTNGCNPLTIREMYLTKNNKEWAKENGHKDLHSKYLSYGYGSSLSIVDGKIKKNKIVDIFYSGKNKVYKIETGSGKCVKCTALHKIPTPTGMVYMKDLKIGDEVYVKGNRVKNVYNYNVYKDGNFISNLPKKGQQGFQKIENGHWVTLKRERNIAIHHKTPCEVCGTPYDGNTRFEMHHIDGDRTNNEPKNLAWFCVSCHKKAHYRMGRKRGGDNGYELLTDKIVSIEYVGIEDVYDIEMADPNHTVLVNSGLVVSNSHSVAYGMTAWVTAYLKCHYPAAYMASLIDSNCKDKAKVAEYVLYCKERGIKVLPPTLRYKKCYSTYDEDGPIIILGLNCIAGVGNTEIPKDAPENFKEFMEQYVSMNKKVIEGLIRAGVFKGNRDEMIQYVSWAKDKRKSKGDFQYIPTDYDDKTEESKVIGVSFGDLFEDYNTSLVDNVRIFAYEVLEVKGRKTKIGKPMAFVKVRNNTKVDNLVIFNGDYKKLSVHKVYIFRLSEGKIMDFKEASKKK